MPLDNSLGRRLVHTAGGEAAYKAMDAPSRVALLWAMSGEDGATVRRWHDEVSPTHGPQPREEGETAVTADFCCAGRTLN